MKSLEELVRKVSKATSPTHASCIQTIRGARPTVMVDLDGVLAPFEWKGPSNYYPDEISPPFLGARDFLLDLEKFADVWIATSRLLFESVNYADRSIPHAFYSWIKQHDFPQILCNRLISKPLAVAYIDDRALFCNGLNFPEVLQSTRHLALSWEADSQRSSKC